MPLTDADPRQPNEPGRDLPPTPAPPPIDEPEPDRLPDETPNPNPDEQNDPPLHV
ncbi:MAG: hypothetical protein IBJ07_19730 [Rhizobiaceae bacterium]|nr:hypothetical protein [Rhizobiaceae bacterium]